MDLVTDSSEEMNEAIVHLVQKRSQIGEMFSMAITLRRSVSPSQQTSYRPGFPLMGLQVLVSLGSCSWHRGTMFKSFILFFILITPPTSWRDS